MGCFTKFFLFVLNFVVFVLGAAVTGLASYLLHKGNQFQELIDGGAMKIPIVFLIFGIFIVLLGFFGCFGALRESPCLLYTYATIVLVLLLAQIAVVIYGTLQKDELKAQVQNFMLHKAFDKYGSDDTDLKKTIDTVQHEFHCCGVDGYKNWVDGTIEKSGLPANHVPVSCCKVNDTNCNDLNKSDEQIQNSIYTTGCFTTLDQQVESHGLWMIIAAIVLSLVQLGCVVIACGIGKNASRHYA